MQAGRALVTPAPVAGDVPAVDDIRLHVAALTPLRIGKGHHLAGHPIGQGPALAVLDPLHPIPNHAFRRANVLDVGPEL